MAIPTFRRENKPRLRNPRKGHARKDMAPPARPPSHSAAWPGKAGCWRGQLATSSAREMGKGERAQGVRLRTVPGLGTGHSLPLGQEGQLRASASNTSECPSGLAPAMSYTRKSLTWGCPFSSLEVPWESVSRHGSLGTLRTSQGPLGALPPGSQG